MMRRPLGFQVGRRIARLLREGANRLVVGADSRHDGQTIPADALADGKAMKAWLDAAVAALDYEIPTLADMEEIELSNRLYMDRGTAYMTAVLPGQLPEGGSAAMPVTFILSPDRLVTVRHHAPRAARRAAAIRRAGGVGAGPQAVSADGLDGHVVALRRAGFTPA